MPLFKRKAEIAEAEQASLFTISALKGITSTMASNAMVETASLKRQFMNSAGDVLECSGTVIEDGWEFYRGSPIVKLQEKGKDAQVLFGEDSMSIDSYKVRVYNYGIYDNVSDAWSAVLEKYGDKPDWKEIPCEHSLSATWQPYRFRDPAADAAYRAHETRVAESVAVCEQQDSAKRLLWKNAGTQSVLGMEKPMQRIEFMLALDERPDSDIAEGKGVVNPWLVNREKNGRVYHDQLITQAEFSRLKQASSFSQKTAVEIAMGVHNSPNPPMVGLVYARVDEKGRVNLSEYDADKHILRESESHVCRSFFDGRAHDAFLRMSREYAAKQSQVGPKANRRLPDLPSGADGGIETPEFA